MSYFSEHSGEEIALSMIGLGGAVLGAAALINSGRANTRVTRLTGRVDDLESSVENIQKFDENALDAIKNLNAAVIRRNLAD